jgi:hypothetical protein
MDIDTYNTPKLTRPRYQDIVLAELRALLPDETLAPGERGRVLLARVTARVVELEGASHE